MAESTTVLASAARTVLQAVSVTVPFTATRVRFLIDVTLDPALASVTPTINGVTDDGTKFALLVGVAIAATGVTSLSLGPGLPVTANVSDNVALPHLLSFDLAVADTDSLTYSVTAEFS